MTSVPASIVEWTAVVVTTQTRDSVHAVQSELDRQQCVGVIPAETILLAVEDPQDKVGSGGATVNALLVVAEHISARRNYSVVNADVLYDSKILIFHLGRQYAYEPCGRPFLPLPVSPTKSQDSQQLFTNLDALFYLLTNKITTKTGPGVWSCSTDMLLDIPEEFTPVDLSGVDACVLSVPGSVQYAARHGVYKTNAQGDVLDIIYRGSADQVAKCAIQGDQVPLVAGVVYFSPRVAETLLSFHTFSPLDACTYMGIDSGSRPLQLALFFDLLLPMCGDVSQEDFISGLRSHTYGTKGPETSDVAMVTARERVWKSLHGFKTKMMWIPEGRHFYLEDGDLSFLELLASYGSREGSALSKTESVHSFVQGGGTSGVTSINSIITGDSSLGRGSLVSHSHLQEGFYSGTNCLIAGISADDIQGKFNLSDSTVLSGVNIKNGEDSYKAKLTWGINDKLKDSLANSGTIFNKPWSDFFGRTGICGEDLFKDIKVSERSLFTARLYSPQLTPADIMWLQGSPTVEKGGVILDRWRKYQRFSLAEILDRVDYKTEFSSRRSLYHTVSKSKIRATLLECRGESLARLYVRAVCDGTVSDILTTLDQIAASCGSPGIAARTLANIADVLGAMARGRGGLRSGPAGNRQWATAFSLLEAGDIPGGVAALAAERQSWQSRPELLVRAARHYEGATQILIRQAVMTAKQFIQTSPCPLPPMGHWVVARSPARIDIAGGWSDTPPITYEHGGAVCNAAITIDGQKPIGAKIRRIPKTEILLHIGTSDKVSSTVVLSRLGQLADYNNPQAPGALLKAALVCAEVVQFPSPVSLEDQLRDKYGGGFELYSWSNLPQGSGLGTSSILAGTILAALWKVSGRTFDMDALYHATAHVEQMLTTGGGWQDQVGGLSPGVKVGHSAPSLPMRICTSVPEVSPETVRAFSDRLVLVYTGKTRLARNLLQNVLRTWYARDPGIVETEGDLVRTAWDAAKAFETGDLAAIGACMSHYWSLKKQMASGCEPRAVAAMMDALRPLVYGTCMAGAGGGGFLYVLTKAPGGLEAVRDVVGQIENVGGVTFHKGAIDDVGLEITVEESDE